MAVEGVGLPFPEAEAFLAQKVNLPTRRSDDLRHEAHVRAFSVAGMTRDDMLADVHAALMRAQTEGRPFDEFKAAFNDVVDRTGWQFYAQGDTEAERRDWRARIIFKTNLRVAYMAGRYKQMTDPDVLKYRPYWRYRHNDVRFPRPQHVEWDGLVLLASDPWWKTHYGPNGWGCQCDAVALNARQLAALGKSGPDVAPDDGARQVRDPRTGEVETRYDGIDRGWEYNPGEAWLHGAVPPELQQPLPPAPPPRPPGEPRAERKPAEDLPPLPPPSPVSRNRLLPNTLSDEEYAKSFLQEFGATIDQGALFRDRSGGIIGIDSSLLVRRTPDGNVVGWKTAKRDRGQYMLLLADALRDPDEIWVDWTSGPDGKAYLARTYIRRVLLPNGRSLFVLFQWTGKGWSGVTAFDTTDTYVLKQRTGALLYRKA